MRRGLRRAHARTCHHDCRCHVRDRRPSARLGVPAPGRALSWGRASSEFGPVGCGNRRYASSCAPTTCQKLSDNIVLPKIASCSWHSQCLQRHRNLLMFPAPTDRPHLAAFILPSSVAGPQQPFSEPESFENSQRLATRCNSAHRDCLSIDRPTNRPAESGVSVDEPTVDRSLDSRV